MEKQKKNSYALSSFILSLLFWLPLLNLFTSALAIVFGIVAMKELKKNKNETGKGIAIAGITIGIITLILSTIGAIVYYFFPETLL